MNVNNELLRLVAENPNLPIVAMVNSDVCWDGDGYWMASFTSVEVTDIGLVGERYYDDRDSFKEAYYDKYDDELCERFSYTPLINDIRFEMGQCTAEELAENNKAEAELEAYLEERANEYMKKCIVVYVNEPDLTDWRNA